MHTLALSATGALIQEAEALGSLYITSHTICDRRERVVTLAIQNAQSKAHFTHTGYLLTESLIEVINQARNAIAFAEGNKTCLSK